MSFKIHQNKYKNSLLIIEPLRFNYLCFCCDIVSGEFNMKIWICLHYFFFVCFGYAHALAWQTNVNFATVRALGQKCGQRIDLLTEQPICLVCNLAQRDGACISFLPQHYSYVLR